MKDERTEKETPILELDMSRLIQSATRLRLAKDKLEATLLHAPGEALKDPDESGRQPACSKLESIHDTLEEITGGIERQAGEIENIAATIRKYI